MKLLETARSNFDFFEETVSSIMDNSYQEGTTEALFQLKCNTIKIDAEIAMAVYPEQSRRCLDIYYSRIAKCLFSIIALEKLANEAQLKRLGMVYVRLYSLSVLIKTLLDDDLDNNGH